MVKSNGFISQGDKHDTPTTPHMLLFIYIDLTECRSITQTLPSGWENVAVG